MAYYFSDDIPVQIHQAILCHVKNVRVSPSEPSPFFYITKRDESIYMNI